MDQAQSRVAPVPFRASNTMTRGQRRRRLGVLIEFLDARCVHASGARVSFAALHEAYCGYAMTRNAPTVLPPKAFGRALHRLGFPTTHTDDIRAVRGLSLIAAPTSPRRPPTVGRRHPPENHDTIRRAIGAVLSQAGRPLLTGSSPRRKARRNIRERYVLPEEWNRLRAVLEMEPPKVKVFFSLLLLEGPRPGELERVAWTHLDLEAGLWFKPKTKNGRSHTIALSAKSIELLRELPRDGTYVFHADPTINRARPEQPWSRTAVEYHWRKIRKLAGIPDVQIRDLRRTCASYLAMQGHSTLTIQRVLNHSGLRLINVYAKLDQTAVREALSRHAAYLFPPRSTSCSQQ